MKGKAIKTISIFMLVFALVIGLAGATGGKVYAASETTKINLNENSTITITEEGTYEISGTASEGQIRVDANNIKGEVVLVLNNVNLTCKDEPAILIYSKSIESEDCTVVIKTIEGTTNTVSGGKIKESVLGENQDDLPYYIEKDYDDDGTYYERYKYDGAISSDVSIVFEGEGTLIINSLKKEGIEGKQNITFNSGNYIINSLDDGINACTDNKATITINGGTVLVNVTDEAEEGDAIDSNGELYINGGKVFAFACEKSQDNGLDADNGIYINGGYVVATGNMGEAVSTESKQKNLQLQFSSKVSKDELIVLTDSNLNPLTAFKTDREYSVLTISTPELTTDNINVYSGGEIEGTAENGLYTKISSYKVGTEKEYSSVQQHVGPMGFDRPMGEMFNGQSENDMTFVYVLLAAMTVILLILVVVLIIGKRRKE